MLIWPEMILTATILLLFLLDVFQKKRKCCLQVTLVSLLLALVFNVLNSGETSTLAVDAMAYHVRSFILVMSLFIGLCIRDWFNSTTTSSLAFLVLWLTVTLGMLLLVAAKHLLMIYMSFELMSLPMVVLVCVSRESQAVTAAWRYFIMTAVGSIIWLLGMVLLYGITGSWQLNEIAQVCAGESFPLMSHATAQIWLIISAVCLLAGFCVKCGLCPMQRWVIDVYQNASWPSLIIISALPKLAIWVIMVRLIQVFGSHSASIWSLLAWIVGAISLGYGTLMAVSMKNLRGLLGYSSIAQMGFMMLVTATLTSVGLTAAGLFMVVYVLMSICLLGILFNLKVGGAEVVSWDELKGLSTRQPVSAFMIALLMFAMAGIPPFFGFIAKFNGIYALVGQGWWLSALIMLLMTVIAITYYTRLIKVSYFSQSDTILTLSSASTQTCLVVGVWVFFILGLYPAPALNIIQRWFL